LRDTNGLHPNEDPAVWPLTEVVRVAASRRSGSREALGVILSPYRDYRGVHVVGAWRWIRELNVGLTTEVDEEEILTALRFIDFPIGLVTLLLGGAGAWIILSSWLLARLRVRTIGAEALGQYTLIEKLGEGGMGEVFLAQHAHLRRPAAVKLLRRDRVSPAFLRQFEREAQAASSLRHPNTVAVYDFGVTNDGLPYYVMEYVPGVDLGRLATQYGPIVPARAVHIARQICSALEEAHEQRILHRDIKPANVMLCELGGQHDFVKILDFGLARDITSVVDETSHWLRSGTPFYTAPERLLPNASVDHRCDIYSLGVLLYFLICGATPYEPGVDWIAATMSGDAIPPSQRVEIAPSLERFILDCMCPEPDGRPSSAREALERLSRLEDGGPGNN
jgi:serine/threonine-protein kinase